MLSVYSRECICKIQCHIFVMLHVFMNFKYVCFLYGTNTGMSIFLGMWKTECFLNCCISSNTAQVSNWTRVYLAIQIEKFTVFLSISTFSQFEPGWLWTMKLINPGSESMIYVNNKCVCGIIQMVECSAMCEPSYIIKIQSQIDCIWFHRAVFSSLLRTNIYETGQCIKWSETNFWFWLYTSKVTYIYLK